MIGIVGIGALGSHVALLLRSQPLRLIDGDRVETRNLGAQFHTTLSLRKNKAQSCANNLQMLFRTKADSYPRMIGWDNADVLLEGCDVVVDCCDNLEARSVIRETCIDRIACVHGCLSADGQYGRVVWNDRFVPDAEDHPGQHTCEDDANLPFHALVAAVVARETLRYLNTRDQWDYEMTSRTLRVQRIY